MMQTIRRLRRLDRVRYRVPRSVQDLIPIKWVYEDGLFLSDTRYSMTYMFTDINYKNASEDDKEMMRDGFAALINSLDYSVTTKFTINNRALRRESLEKDLMMPMQGDAQDVYRTEYNEKVLKKALDGHAVIQQKYITVSLPARTARSLEDVRDFFVRIQDTLSSYLASIGSDCFALNAMERLRIFHDFYRPGEEDKFSFDLRDTLRKGHDPKDYICPNSVAREDDYLKLGDQYCRVLYIKSYPQYINDKLLSELTDVNKNMMVSLDLIRVPLDEARRETQRRLLGIETDITKWQRRQNENYNFSAAIPHDLEAKRASARAFLDGLDDDNQMVFLAMLTIVITADSLQELNNDTKALYTRAQLCQLAPLTFEQINGLNTVLPFGEMKTIDKLRTLTTESVLAFIPFTVQEIMDKGGVYYGENTISHNMILCNKALLLNQGSLLFGVPGSGKSFLAKFIILTLMLNSQDDIFICDPEGEYAKMVEAMGDIGTVIRITAGGRDRLNPMLMVEGYSDNEKAAIGMKSEFILSLISQMGDKEFSVDKKSIIDRCLRNLYADAKVTGITPTLSALREMLLTMPEPQAKELALGLELYTTGSLDVFGKQSNVDLNRRVIVFDIHGLGENLKPVALLVITDTMINRVTLNASRKKRTHVFIDEYHVVYANKHSSDFFTSAWRMFRKRNAYPTAITQNVELLLESASARSMISNSEFVIMLNQARPDRDKLAKLLNISEAQMNHVINAEAGTGLIRYGSALVPFANRFPKDTKLYELMSTKPEEQIWM